MVIFAVIVLVLAVILILLFKSGRGNYGSSTDSSVNPDSNYSSSDSISETFDGGEGGQFGGAGAGGSWGDDSGGGDSSDSGGSDSGD